MAWPKFLLFICLTLLAALGAGPAEAAFVNVIVPAENTVSGDRILLGDIAYIDVINPAGTSLAEALAKIDLGPAPEAGKELVLRRGQLEQRLRTSRLNLAEAAWTLPEELRLTGRGQAVSEDILRGALERYLSENEPYRSGRYSLVNANFSNLPVLPPGRAAYRFVPQNSSNPASLSGTFFFAVEGKEVARVRVNAQVDLSVEVLVATRALNRGHVLAENDLSLAMVNYSQAKGALSEAGPAVGATLKNAVSPGEPIRERNLGKSAIVRLGDVVTLIARQGDLEVSATGQARQDGALGDTISVLNTNSKKTVTGLVIGPKQVEVVF